MLNIILFGPPGAGKGTQSKKIIDRYHLIHLSTGELLREHMSNGTDLGKVAHAYIDRGNLVPDDLVIKMVGVEIDSHPKANGFIFDGFPRTVNQAEALDTLLEKKGEKISLMIALVVDEEELKNRLKLRARVSGRTDDQNEERINNRIAVYNKETLPVAAYYEKQSKLKRIKGVGEIDEIFDDICRAIDQVK